MCFWNDGSSFSTVGVVGLRICRDCKLIIGACKLVRAEKLDEKDKKTGCCVIFWNGIGYKIRTVGIFDEILDEFQIQSAEKNIILHLFSTFQ